MMNNCCSTHKQGTDQKEWLIYKGKFLNKHPLCKRCHDDFNIRNESSLIWHIVAAEGIDDMLFWSTDNHFAVCNSCYAALSRNKAIQGKGNGLVKAVSYAITGDTLIKS